MFPLWPHGFRRLLLDRGMLLAASRFFLGVCRVGQAAVLQTTLRLVVLCLVFERAGLRSAATRDKRRAMRMGLLGAICLVCLVLVGSRIESR